MNGDVFMGVFKEKMTEVKERLLNSFDLPRAW